MTLQLDDEEQGLLSEVLASVVSDLSSEIADTDNMGYRRALKHRRDTLAAVLERVRVPIASNS